METKKFSTISCLKITFFSGIKLHLHMKLSPVESAEKTASDGTMFVPVKIFFESKNMIF